jgi:hypothetical protein
MSPKGFITTVLQAVKDKIATGRTIRLKALQLRDTGNIFGHQNKGFTRIATSQLL